MNATRWVLAVACVAIASACSTVMTATPSSSMRAARSTGPDSATGVRTTHAVDPARVTVGDIVWRVPVNTDVSAEERHLLMHQLSKDLMARVYALPAAPGGRPAVVRVAITRIETVSPPLNALSALLLFVPLDRGGASVGIEAIDPDTSEPVAALTLDRTAPLSEYGAHFDKLGPAKLVLRQAASDFALLLRAPE